MTSPSLDERPDTGEMVVIHRIFRQGFPMLSDAARHLRSGDTAGTTAVATHVEFMLNALHHHHAAEDEHLWPRLAERTETVGLVGRMAEQHSELAEQIDAVHRFLPRLGTGAGGTELADSLTALSDALTPHLDEEEAEILPLVRLHISAPEWQESGDAAFDGFTNDEKLLALGLLLDVASPDEAASFLRRLPWPVRLLWRVRGHRLYARHMNALLRATR